MRNPVSFAGLAGGTVTLDDGSRERIRCGASYAVAGPSMNMTLTCASAEVALVGIRAKRRQDGLQPHWIAISRTLALTAAAA